MLTLDKLDYHIRKLTGSSEIGTDSSAQSNSGVSGTADSASLNENVLGTPQVHRVRAQVTNSKVSKSDLLMPSLIFIRIFLCSYRTYVSEVGSDNALMRKELDFGNFWAVIIITSFLEASIVRPCKVKYATFVKVKTLFVVETMKSF